MNTSKLALALVASIALPLGALAADDMSGRTTTQPGSSQYGTQSGTQQSGSGMSSSGAQSGTSQSDMGRSSGQYGTQRGAGAEGSAALPMFDTLDKNSDGFISKTEAKKSTNANRNFRTLDADRDGKISHDEWQAGGGQTTSQ